MDNVIIYAPIITGRSYVGKKINAALGCTVTIVDEIIGDKIKFDKNTLVIGMGYCDTTPEAEYKAAVERKDPRAGLGLEGFRGLCEQSKTVKAAAAKYGFKFFDVTNNRFAEKVDKLAAEVIEYVKKNFK